MKILSIFAFIVISTTGLNAEVAPKLTVSGNAIVYQPADKLSLTIGVVTNNKEVKPALKANAEKVNAVITRLNFLGLHDKELQTGDFTITPQYAPAPKNAPYDWQPTIAGYEIQNTLVVQTTKLDLISDIIDAATIEGVNVVHNISFSLQDEQIAKSEAITLAVQQAETYANAAAKAARIKLGDIQELAINTTYATPRFLKAESLMNSRDTGTPILPGDVEVSASVSVVYDIIK